VIFDKRSGPVAFDVAPTAGSCSRRSDIFRPRLNQSDPQLDRTAPGNARALLSGPLRDRLDLSVEVPALPPEALASDAAGEPSATVRGRVVGARELQYVRYERDGIRTNTDLTPALLARYCALDRPARRVLSAAVTRLSLSARAYDRVRKVARTIADLEGVESISADHLAEALQFRLL
jgi:magnesium chelatase family protein